MDIFEIVGQNIRSLRKSINPSVSINRLATASEVDPGQLSRAERGLAGLSLPALLRIAETLGVSLVRLIDQQAETISESALTYAYTRKNDRDSLITELAESTLESILNEHKSTTLKKSEKRLLLQQLQAAIEEGVTRGQIRVENELSQLKEDSTI